MEVSYIHEISFVAALWANAVWVCAVYAYVVWSRTARGYKFDVVLKDVDTLGRILDIARRYRVSGGPG